MARRCLTAGDLEDLPSALREILRWVQSGGPSRTSGEPGADAGLLQKALAAWA